MQCKAVQGSTKQYKAVQGSTRQKGAPEKNTDMNVDRQGRANMDGASQSCQTLPSFQQPPPFLLARHPACWDAPVTRAANQSTKRLLCEHALSQTPHLATSYSTKHALSDAVDPIENVDFLVDFLPSSSHPILLFCLFVWSILVSRRMSVTFLNFEDSLSEK